MLSKTNLVIAVAFLVATANVALLYAVRPLGGLAYLTAGLVTFLTTVGTAVTVCKLGWADEG